MSTADSNAITGTSSVPEASTSAPPAPPPPPPPMPGTNGSINVPTYKEIKEKNDEIKKQLATNSPSMQDSQFANLPDKLMNTMKREKKPFTYTPLSVGDNGKLDLSQIKSPKMKKRLLANMKDDEDEQDENKIESIDTSIQNHKNQEKALDRELSTQATSPVRPINQQQQSSYSLPISDPSFSPSIQTKPSLVVPMSLWNDQTTGISNAAPSTQTTLPINQQSLNNDYNRPLSPEEKLNQLLNEQLHREMTPDLNNNYMPSFYDSGLSTSSQPQYYGTSKPKKVQIAQELSNERNFNCVPSQSPSQSNNNNQSLHTYNQTPKQWSTSPTVAGSSTGEYSIPIQIHRESTKPQAFYSPQTFSPQQAPVPPMRQESLKQTFDTHDTVPTSYEEPIQSRSFKILQKLTADIEDEIDKLKVIDQQHRSSQRDPLEEKLPAYYGSLNHIEAPRLRSERRIPIQVENSYTSSSYINQPEYHSKSEQNWYNNSSINSTTAAPSSSNSFWSPVDWTPQTPAYLQRQITPPPRYQGSNIPSRTFKILQMLTDEDGW